jgi:hypothetical protein
VLPATDAAAAAAAETRSSSIPPPPPRRRRDDAGATPVGSPAPVVPAAGTPAGFPVVPPLAPVATAPTVIVEQRPEDPPPQRPRGDDLPVIPRLDTPNIARDGTEGSTSVSTIPPAPRTTTIRSPSEVLQARSAPVPAQPASSRLWSSALSQVKRLGTAARERLPVDFKTKLEGTSPGMIAGVAGVVLVFAGGLGSAIYGLATANDAEPAAAQAVSSAEVSSEVAAAATTDAAGATLTPRATPKTPAAPADETSVLLDLAESMLAQRRDADAVPPLERLIARHPELKTNERVGRLLLSAAASNDRQAASQSHALLTGPMGESGAALLYELSLKSDVREAVRKRAQSWLASKEFERVASLQVYAAVRLRKAASCEDKHALLEFAGKAGGKYVLSYLKELEQKKACAPDDLVHCYPCMRNDSRLADTIAKLEAKP